jgi:threonine dehydrogenase-like Zn-dependent dehydrogenase
MKAKALVLEKFNEPLVMREFDLPKPQDGDVLARIVSAGICGSDIHEMSGRDPRTPLPIIPGHEGVGEVADTGLGACLADGSPIEVGMPVVWERSLVCGKCYFCSRNQEYLCPDRLVYGISISSENPPHLLGNYSTHVLLRKGTRIFRRDSSTDPSILVPATCSGTTASHTWEYAGAKGGETVLIYGCGPIAIFLVAFALRDNAHHVIIVTRSPDPRSEIAKAFGASEILFRSELESDQIVKHVLDRTSGMGIDIVLDTTAEPSIFTEALKLMRRGGVYVNPGLAIPSHKLELDMYWDVVRNNITIRGVWASDASHLEKAISIVQSGKFPFEKLVTHRFKLEEWQKAFDIISRKQGLKVVFEP